MDFRTEIFPENFQHTVNYNSTIFSIGSCFTENISNTLAGLKFNVMTNPFGIVYNPESMLAQLERIIEKQYFLKDDVFEFAGVFRCYDAHSDLADYTQQSALEKLNSAIDNTHTYLKTATHFFITPGTAIVYILNSTGRVVANNHKQPASYFTRRFLSYDEVLSAFQMLFDKLLAFNPSIKIVYTVSPVRHIRDGLVDNTLSKSLLFAGLKSLRQQFDLYYFPAYELVIDDLRDYRFFKNDFVHPNQMAIDYVWEKFTNSVIEPACYPLMESVTNIHQAMQHSPLFEKTEQHTQFRKTMIQQVKKLALENQHLNFTQETEFFS